MTAYSPIVHAELKSYARPRPSRRWWHWVMLLFPALALAVAIEVIAIELLSALTSVDLVQLFPVPRGTISLAAVLLYLLPMFFLLPITLLFALRTWLQTLILASQTIVREKQNGTWDLLLLTGMSTRRLLIGKWWAVLRSMCGSYALLCVMRAALTMFFAVEHPRFALYTSINSPWRVYGYPYIGYPQFPELMLTVAISTLFTLLGAGLIAAMGVIASLLLRRHAFTFTLSMVISMFLPILLGISVMLGGSFWINNEEDVWYRKATSEWTFSMLSVYTGVSIIDNGLTISSELAVDAETPDINHGGASQNRSLVATYYPYRLHLASAIAALAFNAMLLYLLLRIAERIARYQGVLPP